MPLWRGLSGFVSRSCQSSDITTHYLPAGGENSRPSWRYEATQPPLRVSRTHLSLTKIERRPAQCSGRFNATSPVRSR